MTKSEGELCSEAFERWHNDEHGFIPSYSGKCYDSEDSDALFDAFKSAWQQARAHESMDNQQAVSLIEKIEKAALSTVDLDKQNNFASGVASGLREAKAICELHFLSNEKPSEISYNKEAFNKAIVAYHVDPNIKLPHHSDTTCNHEALWRAIQAYYAATREPVMNVDGRDAVYWKQKYLDMQVQWEKLAFEHQSTAVDKEKVIDEANKIDNRIARCKEAGRDMAE